MGWTSYHADYYKKGRIDRKAECDAYFMEGLNRGHFDVLKSSMVGSVYYAAVQTLKKYAGKDDNGESIYVDLPESERKTWAVVFLTHTDMKDYYNFSYKDMDETCGPGESKCPKGILDLLSPTDNEYANAWRNRCYEYHANKNTNNLSNLKAGSVVEFTTNEKTYRVRRTYGTVHLRNGDVYKVSKTWVIDGNPWLKVTTKCINSWGYKIIHNATVKEDKLLRNQRIAAVSGE